MSETLDKDESAVIAIQTRGANLRIAKVKAEKEFLDVLGKGEELSPAKKAALQKKRNATLYQLELEGAEIERDFVELTAEAEELVYHQSGTPARA